MRVCMHVLCGFFTVITHSVRDVRVHVCIRVSALGLFLMQQSSSWYWLATKLAISGI